jgi:hypothetical protein
MDCRYRLLEIDPTDVAPYKDAFGVLGIKGEKYL